MHKAIATSLLAALVTLGAADAAYAQRQAPAFGVGSDAPPQTINFTFGGFLPRGLESRDDHDVLRENCFIAESPDCTPLDFDLDDPDLLENIGKFRGVTFGVEYLVPVGEFFEVGAGLSYYSKTVESVFAFYGQDDPNTIPLEDDDIAQELSLRTVPLSFTARYLPLGASNPVQPYVGGGLNIIIWQYREDGEFIRDFDCEGVPSPCVFRDEFKGTGTKVGPLFLAGVRFASDAFSVGGEMRWQHAVADLDPDEFFYRLEDTKIDLGGWTLQATFGVRFD